MSASCFRPLLLLNAACLLFSCSPPLDSELIILTCLDQDGNPLPPGVTVSVDGVSEIWSGTPLRFPVKVQGDVRLVRIKAGTDQNYTYNSKSQYVVRPGIPTTIKLRFFRSYIVTVGASGQATPQLAGADVFANGTQIGKADARGHFTWTIDRPDTRAGIARPGTRFDIRLERNGEGAVTTPVILAKQQFDYTAKAHLDQEPPPPYYGFAANMKAILAQATTASPAGPVSTSAPGPSHTAVPTATTPSTNPATPITEARPRPPSFNPVDPGSEVLPATLGASTPASSGAAPLTLLQQGDRAFAAGRYNEAKRFYSSVPPGNADFKRARQKFGEIQLETKNYEGAVAAFEEILREDPSEYAAYNNLAAVYLVTESYDEALNNLDQVLAHKHLIPQSKRRAAELDVRYTRASIHYVRFQNERDLITKKEQGMLAISVLQAFIDRVPLDDDVFLNKRREMEDKRDDIRQWLRGH